MASLGIVVASNVDIFDKNLTIQRAAKNCFGNKNVWWFGIFFSLQRHSDNARLLQF